MAASPRPQSQHLPDSGLHTGQHNDAFASPRPSTHMDTEQDYFLSRSEQQAGSTHDTRQSVHSTTAFANLASPASHSRPGTAGYSGVPASAPRFIDEKRYQPTPARRTGFFAFLRKPWVLALLALLVVGAIAGGIAGGVASSHSNGKSSKDANSSSNSNSNSNGGTKGGNGSGNTGSNANTTAPIVPLQRWDWTNKNQKAYGVNLGNWLLLERWLDENNFVNQCSYCGDEWTWSQAMGAKAIPALQAHYNSWFQESDLDFLQSYGVNMVRVTIGFWALIPTVSGEPYVNAGQLNMLGQLLTWLHKRGMYAVISLHGLPGSQSGDQSTGQKKNWGQVPGGQAWFTPVNQNRSDAAVLALANWVAQQGNYSSVVSAILPVNEPKQTDFNGVNQDWQQQLVDYYNRSYATLVQHGIVMSVHPGYYQGQDPSGWQPFMSTKDPNMVIWETHPYPGFFPTVYDDGQIMQTVCNLASIQNDISVPIFFGEWSLLSGVTYPGWVQTYFKTQIKAYNNGAGSTLWNWKANNSTLAGNGGLALASNEMALYDFTNLVNTGIIPKPDKPADILATLQGEYQDACSYNSKRALEEHVEAAKSERMVRKSRS